MRSVFLLIFLSFSVNISLKNASKSPLKGLEFVHKANYLNRTLSALEGVVNFLSKDTANINPDCLFGLRLAHGRFTLSLRTLSSSKIHSTPVLALYTRQRLNNLLLKINSIQKTVLKKQNKLGYLRIFLPLITAKYDFPFSPKQFLKSSGRKLKNFGQIVKAVETARYNEQKGDKCLTGLLGTTTNGVKCVIPTNCLNYMMLKDEVYGYPITHQILYIVTATLFGCADKLNAKAKTVGETITHVLRQRCTGAFVDTAALLHSRQVKKDVTRDYIMEAVLLCGLVGFNDILKNNYLEKFLSWQEASGCYGDAGKADNEGLFEYRGSRSRRGRSVSNAYSTSRVTMRKTLSNQIMKDGCLSHQTGLAAGVLATYAHKIILELWRQ